MAGTSARFDALVTAGAAQNLEAIHHDLFEFDCAASANNVPDELMEVAGRLSEVPERGSYPEEPVGSRYPGAPPGFLQAVPGHLPRHGWPDDHRP